jgi:peptidoglycan/LPS O-acetylase OafA/YrhL
MPFNGAAEHIPALDGMRGVALLAVMFCHYGRFYVPAPRTVAHALSSVCRAGWMGVDLFFALSGFLITGILLRAKGSRHYFRTFYVRRVLRILPLYYGALVVLFVLVPLFVDVRDPLTVLVYQNQTWLWAHSVNLLFAWRGEFLEGGWVWISHFWSLSIEEHFYLLWPLAVFWLEAEALLGVAIAAIFAAPLLRSAMLAYGASVATVYTFTPCRVDGLACGAMVAIVYANGARWQRWRRWASASFCACSLVLVTLLLKEHMSVAGRWMCRVGYTVADWTSAILLVLVLRGGSLSRVFSWGVLRWFGKYSYGAYVLHVLLQPFLRAWMPPERIAAATGSETLAVLGHAALGIGSTMFFAVLSWHAYEKHFLKLKRYFEYEEGSKHLALEPDALALSPHG